MTAYYQANVTDMVGLFTWANNLSGNIFMPLLTVVIWIVCFTYMIPQGLDKGFIFASFVTFVTAVMIIAMGLMQPGYIIIYLLLLGVSGFLAWRK